MQYPKVNLPAGTQLGTIPPMAEYTGRQLLLMKIRDERCAGNAAELARRIGKDQTYVNRLFYPVGKRGGKGVGLEIMEACTRAFDLPAGFWEGVPAPHHQAMNDEDAPAFVWPFNTVPMERYEALTPEDKGYVQRRLLQAIQECEAESALTLTATEERLVAEAHRPKGGKTRRKSEG